MIEIKKKKSQPKANNSFFFFFSPNACKSLSGIRVPHPRHVVPKKINNNNNILMKPNGRCQGWGAKKKLSSTDSISDSAIVFTVTLLRFDTAHSPSMLPPTDGTARGR